MEEVNYFLKYAKYLAIAMGYWDFKDDDDRFMIKFYNKFRYTIITIWFLGITSLLLNGLLQWQCQSVLMEGVTTYFHTIPVFFVLLKLRSKKFLNVLRQIMEYENSVMRYEKEEIKKMYMHYARRYNFIILTFLTMFATVVVIPFYIGGVTLSNKRAEEASEKCHITRGAALQFWYPFGMDQLLWFLIFMDMIIFLTGLFCFNYSKTMMPLIALFVTARLKILQHYIETLDEVSRKKAEDTRLPIEECRTFYIKNILRTHQDIIRLMDTVQSGSQLIILLIFYGHVLDLPPLIVSAIFGDTSVLIRNIGLLSYNLLLLYIFCDTANDIITESAAICDIIYSKIEWRTYDKKNAMLLLVAMMRAQQPLKLNTVPIGQVSIETYGAVRILKMCYSLATALTALYQ